MLLAALAKQIPMIKLSIHGEEFHRIGRLTPEFDGKERLLYWRGADPDINEFNKILPELKDYLNLYHE